MALKDQLLPASYKGVKFLVTGSSVTGGRKTVKHEFPNQDRQTIEDLGLLPRVYTLQISVNGGDNYLQNRDSILSVLEQSGVGKLTHPLYGDIEDVSVRTYTIVENFDGLGEGKINVSFEISDSDGLPTEVEDSLSTIESLLDAVSDSINSYIANNFFVNSKFKNSYFSAVDKLREIPQAFTNATNFIQASESEIDSYNDKLVSYTNDIFKFVTNPSNLAEQTLSIFSAASLLYDQPEDTTTVFTNLFDYGDDDINLSETTADRTEQNKNKAVLNDSIRSLSLANAYFSAAQSSYVTVNDIEEQQDKLEAQYSKIAKSTTLDNESREAIALLRDTTQQFFDEQKLVALQVTNISTRYTSARLLSYIYYGSTENAESIIDLNTFDNVAYINGNVSILTS